MYATKISSPRGMVPRAKIRSFPVFELNENLAFGEHEWLNREALKQIPPSSFATVNEFVPNMPTNLKELKKHEHWSCEL
jgi:hypothetical protein